MPTDATESQRVPKSLLARARQGDVQAIETVFRQFFMPEEKLFFAEFLGTEGIWGIGVHSFAALTDRRLATIRVGAFGEVIYQDGLLEYINSTVVYQPSKLMLYVIWIVLWLAVLFLIITGASNGGGAAMLILLVLGLPVGFLGMVMTAKLYYRIRKCGAVWWIREGVAVYAFSNRKRLVRINALTRMVVNLRDTLIQRTHLIHVK